MPSLTLGCGVVASLGGGRCRSLQIGIAPWRRSFSSAFFSKPISVVSKWKFCITTPGVKAGTRPEMAAVVSGRASITTNSAAVREYYATCFPGLEEIVAEELSSPLIGAHDIVQAKAGVTFRGEEIVGYRANLWLRSAIRVLTLLARGKMDPENNGATEIYNFTRNAVDWPLYLYQDDMHFGVTGHAAECSDIRGGMIVSTRVKDAVCDDVRSKTGVKPVPAPKGQEPDIQLVAVAYRDSLSLYRNMSGTSLHRRGYRQAMHKAALNEATAAGILYLMEWDKICRNEPAPILVDPMCGSGTFLIEAALMAQRQAPGLLRSSWPFEKWHDFNKVAWDQAVNEAASEAQDWNGQLWGSDIHEGALWLAKQDCEEAGVDDIVKLKLGDVADVQLPQEPTLVMTNPPWGLRLEGTDGADHHTNGDKHLKETWIQLGLFLKRECRNATVGVLNGGSKGITRELCLRADRRYPLTVGGVDARLLKYKVLPAKKQDRNLQDPNAGLPGNHHNPDRKRTSSW